MESYQSRSSPQHAKSELGSFFLYIVTNSSSALDEFSREERGEGGRGYLSTG